MRIMLTALLLPLLAGCATTSGPAAGWALVEGAISGERAGLVFGMPESDNVSMRIGCASAGTTLMVWTAPPRRGFAVATTGATTISVLIDRREFRYAATLAQDHEGDWVATAAVHDPAQFLPALRGVPRIAVVTHDGRNLVDVPAPALLDGFERACRS